MIEASAKVKPWRSAVSAAAHSHYKTMHEGAVSVSLVFLFMRPQGHYGAKGLRPSAPRWKITKPDTDKLIRSTLDGMTGIAFRDDNQVVMVNAIKRFAEPGEPQGAIVTVLELA